jgi:lactoylglutathione lyase
MKFGWTIIYVEDVNTTVEFYERCFGLRRFFIHEGNDYAELETGDTRLAFSQYELASTSIPNYRPNNATDVPPGIEIAFISEDVPAAFAKAVEQGARPILEPQTKPWGQVVAYVRDLNGVLVELGSPIG